jgi:hypothetical protein
MSNPNNIIYKDDQRKVFREDRANADGTYSAYRTTSAKITNESKGLIRFPQDGDRGVEGQTDATLAAILKDRLTCRQQGPNASQNNALALEHIEAALELLTPAAEPTAESESVEPAETPT